MTVDKGHLGPTWAIHSLRTPSLAAETGLARPTLPVLGRDHAGDQVCRERAAEDDLACESHDLSEVLRIELGVDAVLEPAEPHHLDGLAIFHLDEHLDVARDALVARQGRLLSEEAVQLSARSGAWFARFGMQEVPRTDHLGDGDESDLMSSPRPGTSTHR